MSGIVRKKNCIDKIKLNHKSGNRKKSDSFIVLQQIYEWTKQGNLTLYEFCELLNYARESISRNGKNPYNGNDDPEIVMG